MALSVVLPVLDEARDIGRLLAEILGQTPPPGGFEVLVVDGGSSDGTPDIVRAAMRDHPELRLIGNPRRLSSAGRNAGARAARGEHVLFLDGHCALPRSDYLQRAIEIFASTGAACLCRPQPLIRLADGKWARAISAARHSRLGHHPSSDIFGGSPGPRDPRSAGAAYTRACLERLGGYDERFDACEDVEFNCRVAAAGLPAYLHPDLAVEYRPRSSPGALLRQMTRYGRGRARLMARHPREVPWPLVLATALCLLLPAILIGWGARAAGAVAAIVLGGWALAAGVEGLRLGGLGAEAARVAVSLLVIPAGLLLGFWRGLLDAPRLRGPRREGGLGQGDGGRP
ncbi:MAG: glycosyltransferase [Candidatus Eisenbacteria bacterium]|uniref:Glycosyltransferase n=1 Tax=Eiseniibacteriota bacterium TaxID=2212470 RepID=A0A937XAV1_UNCEI|nr:glycosyltransferase [Candidatus Eisenbacteria bacterium]